MQELLADFFLFKREREREKERERERYENVKGDFFLIVKDQWY